VYGRETIVRQSFAMFSIMIEYYEQ